MEDELDRLWSEIVKQRDNYKCQVNGCVYRQTVLNSHHFYGRRIYALRWEVSNGITLCVKHHFEVENDPDFNKEVFVEKMGEGVYHTLKLRRGNFFRRSTANLSLKLRELKQLHMITAKSWSTSPHIEREENE